MIGLKIIWIQSLISQLSFATLDEILPDPVKNRSIYRSNYRQYHKLVSRNVHWFGHLGPRSYRPKAVSLSRGIAGRGLELSRNGATFFRNLGSGTHCVPVSKHRVFGKDYVLPKE